MEKENTHSSLQKNVGCSSQTEPRRKETDKKIDTKQQFTLTHTLPSNFYVSTVFYCRITTLETKTKMRIKERQKIATFMFLCKPNQLFIECCDIVHPNHS